MHDRTKSPTISSTAAPPPAPIPMIMGMLMVDDAPLLLVVSGVGTGALGDEDGLLAGVEIID